MGLINKERDLTLLFSLSSMQEQKHLALQVIRVHRASSHAKDAAIFVEVKLAKSVRKTGILNNNGEPAWNDTVTFSQSEESTVFKIRLKEARKFSPDNRIGQADVNVDELLVHSSEDNGEFRGKRQS
ncbi:hypothetical protein ACEPAH_7932 [Sanghuangporus vaninii]